MYTLALIIAILLFLIGLAGTVLPILPGVGIIYGGMIIYGVMTNFEYLDMNFFILQGIACAFILGVDFVASALGTKAFEGSKHAAKGAVVGTIIGLVFLGPLGIIIGPFTGAVAIELLTGRDLKKSLRSGIGTLIGIFGGTVIKIVAEIIMIIYFFIKI
jgi:uncharacterized protein YqgC (DUF456 family)